MADGVDVINSSVGGGASLTGPDDIAYLFAADAGVFVATSNGNQGYNALTDVFEDLVKAGVIDPTKVVRLALQNAASVAGLMITTEAMIAEKPEKKKAPAMPPGGMDDMY